MNTGLYAGENITSKAYSWYVIRENDHLPPHADSTMEFVNKPENNCFYIDPIAADRHDKVIYLTFDAGYENGNIEKILDVLKEEHVHGAFFILENMAKTCPDLLRRMDAEGHLICNHTQKHYDMTKFTDIGKFEEELLGMEDQLYASTGISMAKFYRPPEGRFSEQNLLFAKQLGYKTILWSFAYADWDNDRQPSCEYAKKKILDNTHAGAIILLHPTSSTNAKILKELITEWKSQGYRFGALTDLRAP